MKDFLTEALLVIILGFAGFGLGTAIYTVRDALECSPGCACKSGGECRCFSATTAKCQCSQCSCEPEQVLAPLSEQEFEALKAALKKEIAARKKKCCESK